MGCTEIHHALLSCVRRTGAERGRGITTCVGTIRGSRRGRLLRNCLSRGRKGARNRHSNCSGPKHVSSQSQQTYLGS